MKSIEEIIKINEERSKYILSELDRLERKIDRLGADVFKYLGDLTKTLEAKGVLEYGSKINL